VFALTPEAALRSAELLADAAHAILMGKDK
jgi:hypothetical protein